MSANVLSAVGTPPPVYTKEWKPWYRRAVQYMLDQCPIAASTDYYFADDGDDDTGEGTQAAPWQTLAKAQAIHDASDGDIALLFKRGDTFRSAAGLSISKDGVTIGEWSTGAKPIISNFTGTIASGGAAWTNVSGDVWTTSIASQVGWIREQADPLAPYAYLATTGAVDAQARSWTWSGGTLRIRMSSGEDPNNFAWEYTLDVEDDGVEVSGEVLCRLDNVRLDGWGAVAGKAYQSYPIKSSVHGTGLVVVSNCEGYYCGRHGISQYVTGTGGQMLITGCKTGYVNQTAGTVTMYNGYAGGGGHTFIVDNSICDYGPLPDSKMPTGGGTYATTPTQGGNIAMVFGHAGSAETPAALYIANGVRATADTERASASWLSGLIYFEHCDTANPRAFVVDCGSTHRQTANAHFKLSADTYYARCLWDLVFGDTGWTDTNELGTQGYAYSCEWRYKDTANENRRISWSANAQAPTLDGCTIVFDGPDATKSWRLAQTQSAAAWTMRNCLFIRKGVRPFVPNINQSTSDIDGIAAYQAATGVQGLDFADTYVALDTAPDYEASELPLVSPLVAGVRSAMVAFDRLNRPRSRNQPVIGALAQLIAAGSPVFLDSEDFHMANSATVVSVAAPAMLDLSFSADLAPEAFHGQRIHFTTGRLSGWRAWITNAQVLAGSIRVTLSERLPALPAAGDSVECGFVAGETMPPGVRGAS